MPYFKKKKVFKKKTYKKKKMTTLVSKIRRVARTVTLPTHKFGFMFPSRLRVWGRFAQTAIISYAGNGGLNEIYFVVNNPITLTASNNISGMKWLVGSQHTDGTSPAPYGKGVVRQCNFRLALRTVNSSASNGTGSANTAYPLSYQQNASLLTPQQAAEMKFSSKMVVTTDVPQTVVPGFQIRKNWKMWDIAGVSEDIYMNSSSTFAFIYNGLITSANQIVISLVSATEDGATDSSLAVRFAVEIDLEMELYDLNQLNVNAPT